MDGTRAQAGGGERGERFSSKILRGKPTRCRVIPGRPALLGGGGGPVPRELLR